MSYMFYECNSLTSANLSNFTTSNVKTMEKIFYNCKSLLSLPDISTWDTKNVTDMSYIFESCNFLQSFYDISK